MKYVQQVKGKWIVRITVPDELRPILGLRELVERDLPSDKKTRERLAHGILNQFFAKLDDARDVLEARKNSPNVSLSIAAKKHYHNTVSADTHKRASRPTDEQVHSEKERALDRLAKEQREGRQSFTSIINATTDYELMSGASYFDRNIRVRRLAALRSSFSTGETRWIEPAVQGYIDDNRLQVQRGSQEWRQLVEALTRAEIQALERTLERDSGNFSGQPSDPLLTLPDPEPLSGQAAENKNKGLTLTEALAAFHEERSAGGRATLAPKTMEEHKNAVRMFNEFMNGDIPVNQITKKHVNDYKHALLKTPNRYAMRFPGLTLPQAIKANAKLAEPFSTLAPKTVSYARKLVTV